MYPVIERKGEKTYIASYEGTVKLKPFSIRRTREIMEVFYDGIVDNKVTLIPLERGIEGIGIDDDNEKNQAKNVKRET